MELELNIKNLPEELKIEILKYLPLSSIPREYMRSEYILNKIKENTPEGECEYYMCYQKDLHKIFNYYKLRDKIIYNVASINDEDYNENDENDNVICLYKCEHLYDKRKITIIKYNLNSLFDYDYSNYNGVIELEDYLKILYIKILSKEGYKFKINPNSIFGLNNDEFSNNIDKIVIKDTNYKFFHKLLEYNHNNFINVLNEIENNKIDNNEKFKLDYLHDGIINISRLLERYILCKINSSIKLLEIHHNKYDLFKDGKYNPFDEEKIRKRFTEIYKNKEEHQIFSDLSIIGEFHYGLEN